jgi:hypothetical protein
MEFQITETTMTTQNFKQLFINHITRIIMNDMERYLKQEEALQRILDLQIQHDALARDAYAAEVANAPTRYESLSSVSSSSTEEELVEVKTEKM